MIKPSQYLLTLGLAVGITMSGFAEVAPVVVPNANTPAVVVTGGPGNFNIESVTYPKGLLQSQYLDTIFARNKADRDYFLSTVKAIENQLVDTIMTAALKEGKLQPLPPDAGNVASKVLEPGGLTWMSVQGQAGTIWFSAKDFMLAINRYQAARMAFEIKLETLTAIANGALPSQIKLEAAGSGLTDVPNYGQMDFGPLKKFYLGKLADVTAQLKDLEQHIILPGGTASIMEANKGTSLEIKNDGPKLSQAQLDAFYEQIENAKQWSNPDHLDAVNAYAVKLRRMVGGPEGFIETFGTTERYRPQDPAMQEEWNNLAEAFWARSYLRAMYRMPLGAIGVTFDKKWFELEKYLTRTKDILVFRKEILWDDTAYARQEQNYRNAFKISESRARQLGVRDLKADAGKIMDGDMSFFETGRNLMTWLSGNRNLAETIRMVVKLLAADLYEERLIQKATGPSLMLARYRARYLPPMENGKPNPDDYAKIRDLQLAYDPKSMAGAGNFAPESVLGYFRKVRKASRDKLIEWQNADIAQATVDIALGTNAYINDFNKRQDSLLGEP